MKRKLLGMTFGLGVLIIILLLPWIFMIQYNIKISSNEDDYEIIEADIVEINTRYRGDHEIAKINYIHNDKINSTEVTYYNREDNGKDTIQIAVNKKTGEVFRTGILFSYGDISLIFVVVCLVVLMFISMSSYRKYREQEAIRYAKKLYQRQLKEDSRE
ncbi:MAG: hypothetical protein K2J90_03195 [Lachnospiraceae bacterium]|nr:hypothetical protein [Lachnospiraceae bacterium]